VTYKVACFTWRFEGLELGEDASNTDIASSQWQRQCNGDQRRSRAEWLGGHRD